MILEKTYHCDVFVIGSGIAGISAAITAAESGSSVILACKGKLFSGSSFYPGTWGLGLIGPTDWNDEADLAATIQEVGCNMATPEMVRAFVAGITPAIQRVKNMNIRLRKPADGAQKEFIPCFDHKHRDWNGIEFESAKEVFSQRLSALNVKILPGCDVLDLVKDANRVCGAVLLIDKVPTYIGAGAVVLATGGYGSLFKHHLCTEDVTGVGQYLALKAGCQLVNMEFMQMIPGYIAPVSKIVYNEKTFRFAQFTKPDGTRLLNDQECEQLKLRSTHGPFTSRLSSKIIDFALADAYYKDERGVQVTYSEEMRNNPPEFVKVYFDWLKSTYGLTMNDPIYIAEFAHAANGGIQTNPDASTGVEGLFAAGEVTGGMHGADRIGGLSTANGLVFGTIAGQSASKAASKGYTAPDIYEWNMFATDHCKELLKTLQNIMTENAMVMRNEKGLNKALFTVEQMKDYISTNSNSSKDISSVAETVRAFAKCSTAECILRAALLRKESRGSHYRTDYPDQDSAQERQIIISMDMDGIHAAYKKDV